MVVENIKKRHLIIPIIIGILLSISYFILPLKLTLGLLMAIVGGSLILHDVKIGLAVAVFALPFLPDILSLLYLIALLLVGIYSQAFQTRKNLRKTSIDIPIVLYFILIFYSTITSVDAMGSLRDFALHSVGIAFVFVMINHVETKEDFNRLLTIMVFSAALVSLYGLYQYVVGVEIDRAWLDVENNPDIKARVYSVFLNPNILAEYLIMLTPISVALFWNTKKMSKKLVFLGTTGLMMLAMLLTFSRGGWLGLAFAALVFVILVEKKLLLSIIPISIGAVYLLPDTILNRITSIGNLTDSSNSYRLQLWNITGKVIKDHWKVGVGFGHLPFKQTFETYTRTMPTFHAHNTFLQVLAETGLVGFLVFLGLMLTIFKQGILRLQASEDSYVRTIGAGLVAGMAGLMVHGMVENIFYIPRIIITFWMLVGFLWTLIKIEAKKEN